MGPVRERAEGAGLSFNISATDLRPIRESDLEAALSRLRPSSPPQALRRIEEWQNEKKHLEGSSPPWPASGSADSDEQTAVTRGPQQLNNEQIDRLMGA